MALLNPRLWAAIALAAVLAFTHAFVYRAGRALLLADQARTATAEAAAKRADTIRQRQFNDGASTAQAINVAKLSSQLGDAREKIANLSSRACLDASTVGMLNNIGADPVRAAASEPAGAAETASSGGGIRVSTERDVAKAIAVCRAKYGEVAGQLNSILDIEDNRQGLQK